MQVSKVFFKSECPWLQIVGVRFRPSEFHSCVNALRCSRVIMGEGSMCSRVHVGAKVNKKRKILQKPQHFNVTQSNDKPNNQNQCVLRKQCILRQSYWLTLEMLAILGAFPFINITLVLMDCLHKQMYFSSNLRKDSKNEAVTFLVPQVQTQCFWWFNLQNISKISHSSTSLRTLNKGYLREIKYCKSCCPFLDIKNLKSFTKKIKIWRRRHPGQTSSWVTIASI